MEAKLILFSIFVLALVLLFSHFKKATVTELSFLALGDSYTIGEAVPLNENFPHQTVDLLKANGYYFKSPEIIARTGWTTDELQQAIDVAALTPPYSIVTLLIGVNNQYRGYSREKYAIEFEKLLEQAIVFSGHHPAHVFVLSIPDWGVTPYAEGKDRELIAKEIDEYNTINKKIALQYNITYIDITPGTREAAFNNELLAKDGLHPSGLAYSQWAKTLSSTIQKQIS